LASKIKKKKYINLEPANGCLQAEHANGFLQAIYVDG